MLTGGVGLNAEYVAVPVAPAATLGAGLDDHANTIVDPPEVAERAEHVVDSLALGAV